MGIITTYQNYGLLLENDDKAHYKHVKDLDVERPRMAPAPKTDGMTTTTGTGYFDLYTQDEASDIQVDKYGFERGIKNWEYTIGQGGAMFQAAAKVANEKYKMLQELDQLKDYGRNYFARSYFDIWKEWKEFKTGKKAADAKPKQADVKPAAKAADDPAKDKDAVPVAKVKDSPAKKKDSSDFSDKDVMRVEGIVSRSHGDVNKMLALAQQMANSIDSQPKAEARGRAAENENYHNIANVFFKRALALSRNVN